MIEDNGHLIAESAADFAGWEILHIEDWKPEVKRVHMRRVAPNGSGSFQIVYIKTEYIRELTEQRI